MDHVSPPGKHEPGDASQPSPLVNQEVADRIQRARTRRGHPRPLTGGERARFREAMAPVMRDIESSGAIPPIMLEENDAGADGEFVSVWTWHSDGTGMGVFIPSAPLAAQRVARLAEQIREWEIEELAAVGRSATWPECPLHPDSHPLEPVLDDEKTAVWRCPRAGQVICAIGELASR